jgi:hypothetical protein
VIPYGPSSVSSAPEPIGGHRAAHSISINLQLGHAGQSGEIRRRLAQGDVDAGVGDVPHLGQGPGLDVAALPDDAHSVAQRLHLRQDVTAEEHRPAPLSFGMDALGKDLFHQRIEAGGRLIEDQELDVAGKRRHQCHLLPIAS